MKNKYVKLILVYAVLITVTFILRMVTAQAQEYHENPQQVVLEILKVKGRPLETWVIPHGIAFQLEPKAETHPAPLGDGSIMLCHQLAYTDEDNKNRVAYRCGSDIYNLKAIGILEDKHAK